MTNGPLTALASGGVYAYGSSNAFPANTFSASNYWVDVVYSPPGGTTAPMVTTVTPSNSSTGNPVSVAPTATFSQAVVPSTVSFTVKDSGGSAVAGDVAILFLPTVFTYSAVIQSSKEMPLGNRTLSSLLPIRDRWPLARPRR